jgi:hypothetical protein
MFIRIPLFQIKPCHCVMLIGGLSFARIFMFRLEPSLSDIEPNLGPGTMLLWLLTG